VACAGAAALLLGGSEARATGFLDLSSWNGAAACGTENCVETDTSNQEYIIAGPGEPNNYTGDYIISQKYSDTEDVFVKFNYLFNPSPSASGFLSSAFYSTGEDYIPLEGSAQYQSVSRIYLPKTQSFFFKVTSAGEPSLLTVQDLQAEGVPAPLSALGAGAAFGWIRRRRAQLKAHQSSQL
jgi:hypothetical protein